MSTAKQSRLDLFVSSSIKMENDILEAQSNADIQIASKRRCVEEDMQSDPGLRRQISDYDINIRNEIRLAYLQRGPSQPVNFTFPRTKFGNSSESRRFSPTWFNEHKDWLEYSIAKDAVFCLYCYLFKDDERGRIRGDSFTTNGFRNWKRKETLTTHVGGHNSAHNYAREKCESLMNQKQHCETFVHRQSGEEKKDHRIALSASVDCIRFMQYQGWNFHEYDESYDSINREIFLGLLQLLANHSVDIKKATLDKAPNNLLLTAPDIQKDIVHVAAIETIKVIIRDLGDKLFSILLDDSRDLSLKDQVIFVLRYVNNDGQIIERFLGLMHIKDSKASILKMTIDLMLSTHGLCIGRLRGQGYNGASNIKDEFNELKSLIMQENSCAYCVHCFAHQLQLALVATAEDHIQIAAFFNMVNMIVNVVGGTCKQQDVLIQKQQEQIIKAIDMGNFASYKGKNQESSFRQSEDTRWTSYYNLLVHLIIMFPSVCDVIQAVAEGGAILEQRGKANMLFDSVLSFDFAFNLHLMSTILGITHELSQTLQRKEHDLVNSIQLVGVSKYRLQVLRDNGWDKLLHDVTLFCEKHDIMLLDMKDLFLSHDRSSCKAQGKSNLSYYQVELFYAMVDKQLMELNDLFTETNTELLVCMSCMNPADSFRSFDKEKLLRLARLYPYDFSESQLILLDNQLDAFIIDVGNDSQFSSLQGIGQLAERMVYTKKHIVYPLVYTLISLVLLLPVVTPSVERAFSATKFIKSQLLNQVGDQWMNDNLVTYIEKDIFKTIDNEVLIQQFQNMKTSHGLL